LFLQKKPFQFVAFNAKVKLFAFYA